MIAPQQQMTGMLGHPVAENPIDRMFDPVTGDERGQTVIHGVLRVAQALHFPQGKSIDRDSISMPRG
jgi:hypothetical protein